MSTLLDATGPAELEKSRFQPSIRPANHGMRCREIRPADTDRVIDLLTEGFQRWRRRRFWVEAIARLSDHPTPPDLPKYGYLLETGGQIVGVLLLIFTAVTTPAGREIRCNVSSWFVCPKFRVYGSLLSSRALKHKGVTYTNLTPAPWTYATLEAQGFQAYAKGVIVSFPILSPSSEQVVVANAPRDLRSDDGLSSVEVDLLQRHALYGCVSLVCNAADGRHPFVFGLRRRFGLLVYALLIYSRSQSEIVRFARPLGSYFLRRGIVALLLNANSAVQGLPGLHLTSHPKYFKGDQQPALEDMAFSEHALFAV